MKFAEVAVTEIQNFAFENISEPKNRVLNPMVGCAKLLRRDADLTN